jgi:hypothetical protein
LQKPKFALLEEPDAQWAFYFGDSAIFGFAFDRLGELFAFDGFSQITALLFYSAHELRTPRRNRVAFCDPLHVAQIQFC